jgi:YidC/Oxa1 family membrane protein insertase
MERRTIIAVFLSLGIYYAWVQWKGPPKPPGGPPGEAVGSGEPETAEPAPVAVNAPPVTEDLGPAEIVSLTGCDTSFGIDTNGGGFTHVQLPAVPGPYLVTPLYQWVFDMVTHLELRTFQPYGPDPGPATILTEAARGVEVSSGARPIRFDVESRDATGVVLQGKTPEGLGVRHEVRVANSGEACVFDVHTTFTNPGGAPAGTTAAWSLLDHTVRPSGRAAQHQPTALVDGSLYYGGALGAGCVRAGTQLSDKSGPVPLPGPVSWIGFSDRYFGFYLVPEAREGAVLRFERRGTGDTALDGGVFEESITVPAGGSIDWRGKVYAGENHVSTLVAVEPTLERVVDLGWFAMFGHPLLWLMRLMNDLLSGWGWAIVAVTVILKVAFTPLTIRQIKSGLAMQALQPKIAKLKEQYADNPTELNRATMELMTTSGANPLSGCWPLLVSTPVFLAFYQVLQSNVEFYQEPFAWLRDLSSPDPYCILPLAVTGLMWGQQLITPPPEGMDPAQQTMMKWMPLMFGLFFFTSPSGLAIYMFFNVSLSMLQQWLIKRLLGAGQTKPAPIPAGS